MSDGGRISRGRRRGPPPTGKGQLVGVRLLPDLLGPLDAFRSQQGGLSRPEAIRLLLRDGLLQADTMPLDPSQQSSLEPEAPGGFAPQPNPVGAENE